MATVELENVLKKLMVPDNNVIKEGTLELKKAFAKPEVVIPALADLLHNSTDPTIRQYSAIILRRRVIKNWKNVDANIKDSLKKLLLECITRESTVFVHASIAQAIGSISKHELGSNNWPEVMQFVSSCVMSGVVAEREVGYSLLKSLSDLAAEQLKPMFKDLFPVFEKGLEDSESKNNPFYTIQSMTSLIPFFGCDEEKLLKPLLGKVMEIIQCMIKEDEDKANEALDIFDVLVDIEVGIIVPYVRSLVDFCMQVVGCNDLSDALRTKALYLVCWAARRKAKMLMKEQLLQPLVNLLLQIMSIPEPEDDPDYEEDEKEGTDTNSLPSVAAQALDLLALNSPPDKIIPILLQSLATLFESDNIYQRKAAYLGLGELAEGCSEAIRTKYLDNVAERCMKGITDSSVIVRNAALFALGQYAEHIQPEFSKYHETVLPFLLTFLQNVVNDENAKTNHKGTLTKLFYAIEKFTEGMSKDIVKEYTSGLMEAFLSLLKISKTTHATELAISAIGALVTSAQGHMSSYFPTIMEYLKVILNQPVTLDSVDVHSQTVDTLGCLARYIDPEVFLPVANECMEFGVKVLDDCEDPDLRRCTYGLFASVSIVLKFNITPYLPKIVPAMIESIKSEEGVVVNVDPTEDPAFLVEDDVDDEVDLDKSNDDDDDEEEDENLLRYAVENAYMDEKEDSINSLAEIAENVQSGIMPFFEEIFKETFLMVDYPSSNVRKASITACCRLCIVLHQIIEEKNISDKTALSDCLKRIFPTCINVINKDDDRSVVIACVEVLEEVLKQLKGDLFVDVKYVEELATAILGLMKCKTTCQQFVEEDNVSTNSVDDEDLAAELDQLLIERTGDLVPAFAVAIGGENFKPYFNLYLPEIMKKAKKNSNVSERSFAAGTIAECIQAMKQSISDYVSVIAPWLLGLLSDTESEVRSNTAFGLGVLAEHGNNEVLSMYGNILQSLFGMLSKEQQPPIVQDNICGAVARMISTAPEALPLDQVLPILVGCLPIKEDESENETVTKCFIQLYSANNAILLPYMDKILPWFFGSINNSDKSGLKPDTLEKTKLLLSDLHNKYPTQFAQVATPLGINGFA